MNAAVDRPQLLACHPDNIPEELRKAKRWAPWAAPWDEDKKKYGKVPHRADRPESGLSNGSASGWVSFDRALKAFRDNPHLFAGIGYLMTGAHGVVGVDLDNCVKDGVVAPWAAEIIAKLDSYTEFSPSGTGLHVMLSGELESDWSAKLGPGPHTNKSPGVDVYGGGARFLTVTGAHYAGSPKTLRHAPAALGSLAARYRKSKDLAKLHVLPLPNIVDLEVPDTGGLGLPSKVLNFLAEGPEPSADRSGLLIATGASLAAAGVTPEQAFALLVDNEHTMEVALSKRGYDDTKAREYLWTHHCRRGAAIVEERRAVIAADFESDEDFSDLLGASASESEVAASGGGVADDFEDIGEPTASREPIKQSKFAFQPLTAFMQRPAMSWIIKGFLPQAGIGVLFGASGSGKSFLALDQALAIARGVPWRGARTKQGAVAYVVAEGSSGFPDRVQAYCRANDIAPDGIPLYVLAAAPNLMLNTDVVELGKELKKLGPLSVIYMDTYARVMGDGNENEAKDTNKIIAQCEALHRGTGALVVLIHHSGKDESKGARGSGALRAAADVELEVVRTNKYRALRVSKMKEGEDGGEHQFRLNHVLIGIDEDGDDRTSCAVEHIAKQDEDQAPPAKQFGPLQQRILDQLGTYLAGEVEREKFMEDLREVTPRNGNGTEDANWKMKNTRCLNKLISDGVVFEVNGMLKLQNSANER